jgi:hypothetical protein
MKSKRLITVLLAFMLLFFHSSISKAQEEPVDYFSISGVVKDARTRRAIEHVNVAAKGTNIGTITNEEGEFVLKLNEALPVSEIELSCIGYVNTKIAVSKAMTQNQTFYLTATPYLLGEIEVFSWKNPRDLVELAMEMVAKNYSMQPNLLTGFYRETVQKRRNFINISEAVIQVYKTSYGQSADYDRSQVLKGRNLVSPRKSDTLDVKFLGGPNMPVFLDIVKNPDVLLSKEYLQCYSYRMGEATTINDRPHYVVHFQPQVVLEYPLYHGTLYIDRETFAFTRAEFNMDMSDRLKVTDAILRSKPLGLRFTPEEVVYVVTYKHLNNKTYLNYIRNEIRFKCDWRRRLFATNYTIINETVITNHEEENVSRIPARDAFSMRRSLSSEVNAYYDPDFWGAYNIIEPTESLENAVNRLRRQQQ